MSEAQAILFGLALGDALGNPTEFMSLPIIKKNYGEAGIQQPADPALYTDDTQMTLALTEGLLDAGLDAPLDAQMTAIGHRFVDWMRHAPHRAPGLTCLSGTENFERDPNWRTSGIQHSKGCGSAMRVATIGYLYQYNPMRLIEVASASSVITHNHPSTIASAIAAAVMVKLALDGVHPKEYLHQVMEITTGISPEFDQCMYRVGQAHFASEERCLRHIGEGWIGEEAVGLALWCVARYPDDYVAVVRRAANTNGDSDSIACIAGGISAARLGMEAIPTDWVARCENADGLVHLAERITNARI